MNEYEKFRDSKKFTPIVSGLTGLFAGQEESEEENVPDEIANA